MSEKLLKLLLTELQTVRIICQQKKCGAITEVSLEKLRAVKKCPVCGKDLLPAGTDLLAELQDVMERVAKAGDHFAVQFALPGE